MTNGSEPTERPIYLWAAIGTPDAVPGRIKVESCPQCGSVVTDVDRHAEHHQALRAAGVEPTG